MSDHETPDAGEGLRDALDAAMRRNIDYLRRAEAAETALAEWTAAVEAQRRFYNAERFGFDLMESNTPTVWCDPCIAPIVKALNEAGLPTVASCCGHNGHGSDGEQDGAPGWVMLRDGRTLWITTTSHEGGAS